MFKSRDLQAFVVIYHLCVNLYLFYRVPSYKISHDGEKTSVIKLLGSASYKEERGNEAKMIPKTSDVSKNKLFQTWLSPTAR